MKTLILVSFLVAGWAYAQTCVVQAPAVAPRARQVTVNCPGDGGTTGCTMSAYSSTGSATPGVYPVGNTKCAVACSMGDQAVANDNGWNDGGTP